MLHQSFSAENVGFQRTQVFTMLQILANTQDAITFDLFVNPMAAYSKTSAPTQVPKNTFFLHFWEPFFLDSTLNF
jgi:hypothetical protein